MNVETVNRTAHARKGRINFENMSHAVQTKKQLV